MYIKVNSKPLAVMEGESLMATLLRHNQFVTNICNGRGTCGKCKVRILSTPPEPSELEYQKLSAGEIADGIRLACQIQPYAGMELVCGGHGSVDRKEGLLFIPEQVSGQHSGLHRIQVELDRPSLEDERGDWDRLLQKLQATCSLPQLTIGLPQLQTLASLLRQENFSATVILWEHQVLAVQPGHGTVPVYGVAIDIGTTNIAVALYELETGRMVRLAAAENGQTRFGADVISRIEFANRSQNNRDLLRKAVTETINGLLTKLCTAAGIDNRAIFKAVLVGNTTMHHLFLGLDVSYLALSPFVSVCNASMELGAAEVGLDLHPQARVLMFPNVGGFVGGDTVGAVFGAEELLATGRHLLIDIGTNCELYLQDGSRMWACSTAAGPAFEGAGITYGMRAQPGAIERVLIDEQGVTIAVIGGGAATGICGSGLIEAVQQMRRAGIINQQGAIVDPEDSEARAGLVYGLKDRIRNGRHGREFVLSYSSNGDDVVLTQRDISQLQLAKGAVCAGIRTLLDISGLKLDDLDSVVLAGTFAAHLNLASTVDIGLIPYMSMHKLKTAGNAAHAGAVKALLDQRAFASLRQRAENITHVELGGSSTFSMYFMESMYIDPCHI
ncbi:Na(+)-translocating NADH-quinone reductase subunit F [Sporomusa carbonis]|uniref:ASKHA domain-containing protein n=1 Tax=Sporomusa carbonis TaxID=3076075 RepID=UPI003A6FC907